MKAALLCCSWFVATAASTVLAQSSASPAAAVSDASAAVSTVAVAEDHVVLRASVDAPPAELTFWNRSVVVLRATLGHQNPARRVEAARDRLRQLADDDLAATVRALPASIAGREAVLISVDDLTMFTLFPEDAEPGFGTSLESLGRTARDRLADALRTRWEERGTRRVALALGQALVATLALVLVIRWGTGMRRRWIAGLESRRSKLSRSRLFGVAIGPFVVAAIRVSVLAFAWALRLVLAYLWLVFVLSRFAYSRPWAHALGGWLRRTLLGATDALIEAVPGLATVALIGLAARLATRFVREFTSRVESGAVDLSWLPVDSARVARRIVVAGIWLTALAIAYPFVPGSSSAAFQGITVLVGLMVTIGSAGLLNHLLAGWVILFSRSMAVGDYVKIGEHEGRVLSLGVLATRLRTPRQQIVAIPNAVVTATVVTNYSRDAAPGACWLTASVTIGYDAPWRQVEAMLLEAGKATEGILSEPEPRVFQRRLDDFYVAYDLLVEVDLETRAAVLSRLHGKIQDLFNEHGVQILSPHFLTQPVAPVVVPRSKWHAAPAASPGAAL